ncbi:melatonin receptor type 1B-B-like [Acropora muricata]|uniref:melatonin receptor type 1B-B-like n=1 Tax=Acropora muricata TaxID=159855 RepID=UPI0034E584D1
MAMNEQNILSHELLERPVALVVLESAVMIIIDVLAFTGNLLVCWAVYHNRNLRTVTNMYVVSLAISDGLMASLCIPFSVILLVTGKWPFGFEVCQFFGFFCFFFGMVSVLLITATSVNRYFCVVRPNVYKRFFKVKPTFVSIVVILALAALGAGLSLILGWASYFVHYGKVACFIEYRTAGEEKTYLGVSYVFFMFIPVTVSSCCYYKIVKTVKQHKREVHASGHGRALYLNVKEINITKSLFAAIVGFGLCWGPVAVVDLLDLYTENKMAIPRQVFLMYVYLAFGSSAINPVIYGIMRKAFRTEFLRVLTFRRRNARIQPHQSDSEIQQPKRTSNQAVCKEV